MKLSPKDRRQLYFSGTLTVILIAIGAGLVWWSTQETKKAQASVLQAERRANDIRNRLRQINTEEQEIRNKSALYRQLEQRKIVGAEQRLDWIELIDSIREQHRLFEIDYEVSQQKQEGTPVGDFRLSASDMSFHLPLLHEGDLLNFIEDLQQRAPALIHVKQCEISRSTGKAERQAGEPNLDAHCQLRWNTIGRIESKGVQP